MRTVNHYFTPIKIILFVILLLGIQSTRGYALFPGLNIALQGGAVRLSGKHDFSDGVGNVGTISPSSLSYAVGGLLGYAFEIGTSKTVAGFDIYYNKYGAHTTSPLTITSGNSPSGTPNTGASQGTFNIKMQSSMGGSVIAGILMNPRIITYAKVGYEITKFSAVYSNLSFDKDPEIFSQSSKGLVPSVGGALLLSPRFYVGAEASFPLIKQFAFRSNQVAINGQKFGFSYRPIILRIMFQIGMRFGG